MKNSLCRPQARREIRVYGAGEFSAGRAVNCPESTVVIGYSGFPAPNIAPAVERLERAWTG